MNIIRNFEQYLQDAIGARVTIAPWQEDLPFFLNELYDFYKATLFEKACVIVIPKGPYEITPATISNHLKQLESIWGGVCIYTGPYLTSYDRKRLIEYHVPFVIPGNQMYLPDFLVDLREHFRKAPLLKKALSPATQVMVINALVHSETKGLAPSKLSKSLGYTTMTMTRAFNELVALGIGKALKKGRERLFSFESKDVLWKSVKQFLRNPVKKRVWLKKRNNKLDATLNKLGFISGLSALSRLTLLNPPAYTVYAVNDEIYKGLMQTNFAEEVLYAEEADFELEIWNYNPKLFAKDGLVDPFSLYLILCDGKDERVIIALEKIMEHIEW